MAIVGPREHVAVVQAAANVQQVQFVYQASATNIHNAILIIRKPSQGVWTAKMNKGVGHRVRPVMDLFLPSIAPLDRTYAIDHSPSLIVVSLAVQTTVPNEGNS